MVSKSDWGIVMNHWGNRVRRPLQALLVALTAVVLLSTTLFAAPKAEAFSRPELVFTLNGVRIDAQTLDGAAIPAGSNLAIWIAPRYHPAKKVDFYLNGEHVQTEWRAPWDLSGTGAFDRVNSMWSSDLPEGTNVVEARIDGWFNRDSTLTATFERLPEYSSPLGLDFTEAENVLDAYVRNENLNGAGLVVVHPDHGIVHETYRGEIGPDRVSLIASTNKMISAGVLLHLADQGLLDMNRPISDVVDWGAGLPGVTPAQLVSNSSGLGGLPVGYLTHLCAVNIFDNLSRCGRQIALSTADDFYQAAPDTEYRYGGPQWQVAGAVAEAVSGKSWAQLINEIYVQPCGLDVLGYTNLAQAHLFFGGLPYPGTFEGDVSRLFPTANPLIEGGGYTTPHDYAELLLMLLRGGTCGGTQVLSPAAIDLMLTDRIGPAYNGTTPGGTGYGLGWTVDGPIRTDPGAFGAMAWLDLEDGYGAYFVLEHIGLPGTDRSALLNAVEQAMASGGLATG